MAALTKTSLGGIFFDEAAFSARPRPTPAGLVNTIAAPVAPLASGPTSPTLQQEVSFISGISADGTIATMSYWSAYEQVTAYKFGASTAGTGATISYAFDTASGFSATEQATFREALGIWQSVADVHFVNASSQGQANILLHRGDDGGAYTSSPVAQGSGATLGHYTGQATISIDTSTPGFDLSGSFGRVGGYGIASVIHEIGHALGLGHAGYYNDTVDPATQQFSAYDDGLYSTMSYLSWADAPTAKYRGSYPVTGTDWGVTNDGYARTAPHTVQQLDILAIQRLYGATRDTVLSGGQVYGFNSNVAGSIHNFFDFTKNTAPVVTLYNQGTNNTLDVSAWHDAATINLNAGKFSSVGGLSNNLGIAFGTQINTLRSGAGNDVITGNDNGDTLSGGGGNDRIAGGSGNDVLDGGAGTDILTGGSGNDIYVIDSNSDRVIEAAGGGYDSVTTTLRTYTLGAEIEALAFSGSAGVVGNGNALGNRVTGGSGSDRLNGLSGDDQLIGGAGDDRLDGGSGADTLTGGAGDDTYVIDDAGDRAIEAAGGGYDSVTTTLTTYTLAAEIEALSYTGSAAARLNGNSSDNEVTGGNGNDVLSGLAGDDQLIGGAGDDRLDGGTGADTLTGGAGDDTYVIDDAGDRAIEASGGGYDSVTTTLATYTLAAETEALSYTGSAAARLNGNSSDNEVTGGNGNDVLSGLSGDDALIGGGGNDRLDGGSGADTLTGGAGDDLYIIDDAGDRAIEAAGGGYDTVSTTLRTYTLAAEIEALAFGGSAGVVGSGNALGNRVTGGSGGDRLNGLGGNDQLIGGAGDDRLDGGSGADTLSGGTGDDTYVIDNVGDRAIEAAGGGYDTVTTTLRTYSLGAEIEALAFTGSGDFNATGNRLANRLTGGSGDDVLNGVFGNDTLIGGAGDDRLDGGGGGDTLAGGAGSDVYLIDYKGDTVREDRGQGTDTVFSEIDYTLGANVENLTLVGRANHGTGNSAGNVIIGGGKGDVLSGLKGNDTLEGGGGKDAIDGGAGRDTIVGGAGRDTLTGGKGADVFVFASGDSGAAVRTADTITDFSHRLHDVIDLSAIDAIARTHRDDSFAFIGDAAFGGHAGELRYGARGADTLLLGDTDGDGAADLVIRLSGHVTLVAADFAF